MRQLRDSAPGWSTRRVRRSQDCSLGIRAWLPVPCRHLGPSGRLRPGLPSPRRQLVAAVAVHKQRVDVGQQFVYVRQPTRLRTVAPAQCHVRHLPIMSVEPVGAVRSLLVRDSRAQRWSRVAAPTQVSWKVSGMLSWEESTAAMHFKLARPRRPSFPRRFGVAPF